MTNLTPAQIEQFESTFRYFDRDETNTLSQSEMTAALASLGIVYSDEDMNYIYDQLVQDYGAVTFEAFINLLVDITEDQTSAEQLREAFCGIAADKVQTVLTYLKHWIHCFRSHSLLSLICGLRNYLPAPSDTFGR